MSFYSRKTAILARLALEGEASIAGIAKEFGVSEMTVRRDLEILESEGLARRVRGGAISATSRSYEPPILTRSSHEHEAKKRIGKAAANLLKDGETVIIDVGTTTLEMVKSIDARLQLTVVTSSLPIAGELAKKPQIRTIVTGGVVRKGELSLTGARAEDSFRDLNCDTVFLGVAGVTADKGLTEYNLDDTRVKMEAIKAASRCIVLADASKIGKVAFANVAPLSAIDILITNALPSDKTIKEIKKAGVEIIHVEPLPREKK